MRVNEGRKRLESSRNEKNEDAYRSCEGEELAHPVSELHPRREGEGERKRAKTVERMSQTKTQNVPRKNLED